MKKTIRNIILIIAILGLSVQPVCAVTIGSKTTGVNLTQTQMNTLSTYITNYVNQYRQGKVIKIATTFVNDTKKKSMVSFKTSKKLKACTKSSTLTGTTKTGTKLRSVEQTKKFSHTRPNGKSWSTTYKKATKHNLGEDLAKMGNTAQKTYSKQYLDWLARYIVLSWYKSPTHKKVMEDSKYKYIGVGTTSVKQDNKVYVYTVLHLSDVSNPNK